MNKVRISLLNFIFTFNRRSRTLQYHCSGIRSGGILGHILLSRLSFIDFVVKLEWFRLSMSNLRLVLLGRQLFRKGICIWWVLSRCFMIEFASILNVSMVFVFIFYMSLHISDSPTLSHVWYVVIRSCLCFDLWVLLLLCLLSTNKIKSSILVLLKHHIILIKK